MESAPTAELLLRHDEDGIATLTLNRPRQYNALCRDLVLAMERNLEAIAADPSVRVVIVTGAGSAFCAGHDLKEMRSLPGPEVEALFEACSRAMQRLVALPQPVIAAVNGLATAAGCQLAAQCDLAVASSDARFAVSGINLGLFCSTPAVALSRNVGRKRAAELLFTGDFIDAETALDWGLVNRVCPADRVAETARDLARRLIAKPRESLALGKALFYRQLEQGLAAAYEDATRTIACNFGEPAAVEGVSAFLEKRPPRWPD
ncbi:MAG TPA: enoyl-CoA hydratase [Usitatibacteraceae bacterium]|nr:enoyl-CoA hydratase [Usitatibacteraceae bacterium]